MKVFTLLTLTILLIVKSLSIVFKQASVKPHIHVLTRDSYVEVFSCVANKAPLPGHCLALLQRLLALYILLDSTSLLLSYSMASDREQMHIPAEQRDRGNASVSLSSSS